MPAAVFPLLLVREKQKKKPNEKKKPNKTQNNTNQVLGLQHCILWIQNENLVAVSLHILALVAPFALRNQATSSTFV